MHLLSAGWNIVSVLASLNEKQSDRCSSSRMPQSAIQKGQDLLHLCLNHCNGYPCVKELTSKSHYLSIKQWKISGLNTLTLSMKHPHPSAEGWSWLPESQTKNVKQQGEQTCWMPDCSCTLWLNEALNSSNTSLPIDLILCNFIHFKNLNSILHAIILLWVVADLVVNRRGVSSGITMFILKYRTLLSFRGSNTHPLSAAQLLKQFCSQKNCLLSTFYTFSYNVPKLAPVK